MAWEENSCICLHMQLIAILSQIGIIITLRANGTKLNIGLESPLPIMAYLLACAKVTTFRRICSAEMEILFPVLLRGRPQWKLNSYLKRFQC